MSYLDDISELAIQAQQVIADLGEQQAVLSAAGEPFGLIRDTIIRYTQLLSGALDETLDDETRLKLLTRLVNDARIDQVPFFPYPPIDITIAPTTSYIGDHNVLSNIFGNGFYHLSAAERALLLTAIQPSGLVFSGLLGSPYDNTALAAALNSKQGSISPTGNPAQFLNGNLGFAGVAFNQLSGVPITLTGYGITSSDTLFDGKYLQLGSLLTGLVTTSNTAILATDTVLGAFGKLQAQVNNRESSLGNPAANGYVLSSTTAGIRSWVPAPTGAEVTAISIDSANGFAGSVVISSGSAAINLSTSIAGIVKGNGTALSTATEGTDYVGTTGANNGDTVIFSGGVATWAAAPVNPMTTLGDIIYGGASGTPTRRAGDTTNTRKFLRSLSTLGTATAPVWDTLLAGDIPTIAQSQVFGLVDALANKLDDTLTEAYIFVGSDANAAVGVPMSGDGSLDKDGVMTIANDAVSFAKMQNVSTAILLGRWGAGSGDIQQITIGSGLSLSGSGVLTSSGSGGTPGGSSGEIQWNNAGAFDGFGRMITDGTDLWVTAANFFIANDATAPSSSLVFDVSLLTGAVSWIVPDSSDTFVGEATTQALTNKTLTSPVINVGSDATGDIYYRNSGGLFTRLGVGSNGQVLTLAAGLPSWANVAGTGDVMGPGSSTDNAFARFDGLLGKTIQNSTATLNDSGVGTFVGLVATGASALTLGTASSIAGAIVFRNGTNANTTTIQSGVASASVTYTLPTADGTSGQVLQTNGSGVLSWVTGGGGGMAIGGSITSATAGSVLFAGVSGVLAQDNSNFFFDDTNNRLGIGFGTTISARLALGAGSASVPHFTLTPSSAAFTGTTDGMLTYQNVSSVPNLVLYKGTGATNVLTTARNSDFATGSSSGVIVSDSSGNLTKSSDLAALGIFSTTTDVTVASTATATTLIVTVTGSTTLSSTFWATGKTIKVFASGTWGSASGSDSVNILIIIGGVTVATIPITHSSSVAAGSYWEINATIVCRSTGASGTVQAGGMSSFDAGAVYAHAEYAVPATSSPINMTGTTTIDVQADWNNASASNTITATQVYAHYLN